VSHRQAGGRVDARVLCAPLLLHISSTSAVGTPCARHLCVHCSLLPVLLRSCMQHAHHITWRTLCSPGRVQLIKASVNQPHQASPSMTPDLFDAML
jgi:hypothetical protein